MRNGWFSTVLGSKSLPFNYGMISCDEPSNKYLILTRPCLLLALWSICHFLPDSKVTPGKYITQFKTENRLGYTCKMLSIKISSWVCFEDLSYCKEQAWFWIRYAIQTAKHNGFCYSTLLSQLLVNVGWKVLYKY